MVVPIPEGQPSGDVQKGIREIMIDWSRFHTVGTPRSGRHHPKKPYITFGFTLVSGKVALTHFIIGGPVLEVLAGNRLGLPYDIMADTDGKAVAIHSPMDWVTSSLLVSGSKHTSKGRTEAGSWYTCQRPT